MGIKIEKNKKIDITRNIKKRKTDSDFDFTKIRKAGKLNSPVLFYKGRRMHDFFTEDSKLYITPSEYELSKKGIEPDRTAKRWDSLGARVVRSYSAHIKEDDRLYESYLKWKKNYKEISARKLDQSGELFGRLTLAKAWNASIVTSLVIGMFTMSLIYKYLGPSASAGDVLANLPSQTSSERVEENLGPTELELDGEYWTEEREKAYINEVIGKLESQENEEFKNRVKEMVKGYPIEEMLPYILEKDKIVVAFLIGMGKKESNWGKRVPVLNGQDCFNYWGFRAVREKMGTGGHTCFDSRKDAVNTVARRIENLIKDYGRDTPEKMIVWKCGYSCEGHSDYSVKKWISDVDIYFKRLMN